MFFGGGLVLKISTFEWCKFIDQKSNIWCLKWLETKLRNVEKTKVIMHNFSKCRIFVMIFFCDFWIVSIHDIDD